MEIVEEESDLYVRKRDSINSSQETYKVDYLQFWIIEHGDRRINHVEIDFFNKEESPPVGNLLWDPHWRNSEFDPIEQPKIVETLVSYIKDSELKKTLLKRYFR